MKYSILILNKQTLSQRFFNKLPLYCISLGILLGIIISSIMIMVMKDSYVEKLESNYEQKILILDEKEVFTPEKLKLSLQKLNIKYWDIVYAQAKLETNNFTSRIFRENSNLFGMKVARQRATTAIGEQYGHAHYDTWLESVQDYALFYNRYLSNIPTREKYFDYLRQNYAEDPNYVNKVKKIIE